MYTLYGIALVPVILALVEVAKASGLPSKFAPLLSLALGIAGGLATEAAVVPFNAIQGVVIGIAMGLAASGLYSGVAKLTEPLLLSSVAGVATPLQPMSAVGPAPEEAKVAEAK